MLPLYSPFLNIVEQALSCLKAVIKADISRPKIQRRMDSRDEARARGIPLGKFRTQQLLEALHRNIDTVTAAKSAQWYRFRQTYLPKCLNREIMKGWNWKQDNFGMGIFQLEFDVWILKIKTLNCLYKRILNDCLIHTNAVQECYWIANSVIKMLMNGFCTILIMYCLYSISRWCKWLEC